MADVNWSEARVCTTDRRVERWLAVVGARVHRHVYPTTTHAVAAERAPGGEAIEIEREALRRALTDALPRAIEARLAMFDGFDHWETAAGLLDLWRGPGLRRAVVRARAAFAPRPCPSAWLDGPLAGAREPRLGAVDGLDLSHRLGDDGARRLARHPDLHAVSTLDIGASSLSVEALGALLGGPAFGAVTTLWAAKARPGDRVIEALVAAPCWQTVTALVLDDCAIGPAGWRRLAAAERARPIGHLSIGGNVIGVDALAALLSAGWMRGVEVVEVEADDATWVALGRRALPPLTALRRLEVGPFASLDALEALSTAAWLPAHERASFAAALEEGLLA